MDCLILLQKWHHVAEGHRQVNGDVDTIGLEDVNAPITLDEVRRAVARARNGKAVGVDGIPVEVLRGEAAIQFLHRLFVVCFESCRVPAEWRRGVINPIPKNATADPRNPLNYRGITLAPSMYRLYCSVLNTRLVAWADVNGLLADEQNGFRAGRSCNRHKSIQNGSPDRVVSRFLPLYFITGP